MEQKLPFKQSMSRLEEIIAALEKNEIELEDAIALFEEGLQLVNSCDSQLKNLTLKAICPIVWIRWSTAESARQCSIL